MISIVINRVVASILEISFIFFNFFTNFLLAVPPVVFLVAHTMEFFDCMYYIKFGVGQKYNLKYDCRWYLEKFQQ